MNRRAFSLIELIVVIGIIGLLLAFLLPALEKGRESANAVKCASNLRTLGQSLAIYANENHGQYPRTTYVAGNPPVAGTGKDAPDAFVAGGPAANDMTAPLYLLARTQSVPLILFICPYNDVNTWEADNESRLPSHANFTDYRRNLGYSYANPYPSDAVRQAGYELNAHMDLSTPIMADLNPGTGGNENSTNHEERGQNVLYADGHVQWEISPLVGINKDNIYITKSGAVMSGPMDPTDSILLPAQR